MSGADHQECAIVSCVVELMEAAVVSGTRTRRRPVAIDVFAGVGGMSLGFEQAGFDVLAALEYDPIHAVTYRYNFPLTEVACRDVRRVRSDELVAAAHRGWRRHHPSGPAWDGRVDALIGGPSCQGFSSIGRRDRDDERNQLLLEFVRLVAEIQPRVFCLENVPGLLDPIHRSIRDRALTTLVLAGYRVTGADHAINAADFGVPQDRKRLLIMGSSLELVHAPQPKPGARVTVREALDGLPDPTRYTALTVTDSVVLNAADQANRCGTSERYARVLAGLAADPADRSRPRSWDPIMLTSSRLAAHTSSSVRRFAATAPGSVEPVSRLYRLPLDGQARTLRAGTGRERGAFTSPRPIHPTQPRVVTVREAARLHSFPDWFRFNVTNWHGHRQIGNSVPPLLARAVARQLVAVLGTSPVRGRRAVPLGSEDLLRLPPRDAMSLTSALPDQVPPHRTRRTRKLSAGAA